MTNQDFESLIAHMDERERGLMSWLWKRGDGVIARMATIVGVHESTISRVLKGGYQGHRDGVFDKIEARKKRIERIKASVFVETEVTRAIFDVLDRARDFGRMALIRGASRRGKTFAIKEWVTRNSNGVFRPVYIDAPVSRTMGPFIKEIAKKLGIASSGKMACQIREAVEDKLTENYIIIVDEATRLTELSNKRDALEWLRRLHDTIGCGVVLCATDWFSNKIEGDKVYFEQLIGRLEDNIPLESKVSDSEIRAHIRPYIPKGEIEKGMMKLCREICRTDGKIAYLNTIINDSLHLAKEYGRSTIEVNDMIACIEARKPIFSESE